MIELKNEHLHVVIDEKGAQLHSVYGLTDQIEYLWQGDDASWCRQAPVLFPFVGRLKNDQYEFNGQTYHQKQHGFARDQVFEVTEQTTTKAVFELKDNEQTRAVYPFAFVLTITYELDGKQLLVSYQVTNPSEDETLIYALGAHPGFNVPVDDKSRFENTQLKVSPAIEYQQVKLVGDGPYNDLEHPQVLDVKQPMTLKHELFNEDALIFATKEMPFTATLQDPNSSHGVNVQVNGALFVGVWSSYPNTGNFVCVEPWWGIADNINSDGQLEHKQVMTRLAPGEHKDYGFAIQPF